MSRLRLLTGPVRPFIISKIRDALAKRGRRARAVQHLLNISAVKIRFLGHSAHPEIADVAQDRANGIFDGYGVQRWDPQTIRLVSSDPDPRAVLELARMHQWTSYAVASSDGSNHWYDHYSKELRAFDTHHQPLEGPLWQVAMDTGIRVYNMLLAADIFQQHGFENEETTSLVARMAVEHAIVIEGTLETAGGMATSHLLGDLLGLVAVSKYTDWVGGFPAASVLRSEVKKQILADGMSFEASTGYHFQVVDILVLAQRLLGENWPEVSRAVTAQNELRWAGVPLIGDNDDGLVLKPRAALSGAPSQQNRNVSFPDFGLWIWHRRGFVLTARNGPVGQYGKGGHAHEDQNSVTLRVGNNQVIADPGCSVYTADAKQRNVERSSGAHATVNLHQGWYPKNSNEGLFWLLQDDLGRSVHVPSESEWEGRVQAFGRPSETHRRKIVVGESISVTDTVSALAPGRRITIPLSHGCDVVVEQNKATVSIGTSQIEITWTHSTPELVDGFVSEQYGSRKKSKVLHLTMQEPVVDWSIVILNE